jgi:hypothetical protein
MTGMVVNDKKEGVKTFVNIEDTPQGKSRGVRECIST